MGDLLPGLKPKRIKQLQDLADEYEDVKNRRCALSTEETKAKAAVEKYMIEQKIDEYSPSAKMTLVIEKGKKVLKIVRTKDKKKDAE